MPAHAGLVWGFSTRGVGHLGGLKIGAIAASDKQNFRYCFATIEPMSDNSGVLIVAHRGASRAQPENTPAAFRRADEMGADGVELDVRIGDGALVVAHDPLPIGGARSGADPAPSLVDVLDACGARMLVNVEIKNSESDRDFDASMSIADRTVELLRRRDDVADRWLISSFSWATIDHCRQVAPEFATAALCTRIRPGDLEQVARSGHAAVHPAHSTVDGDLVARAHSLGLAVNVWTVNDADRIRELRDLGVDAVVTDVPDEALRALGRTPDATVSPRWGTRA